MEPLLEIELATSPEQESGRCKLLTVAQECLQDAHEVSALSDEGLKLESEDLDLAVRIPTFAESSQNGTPAKQTGIIEQMTGLLVPVHSHARPHRQ